MEDLMDQNYWDWFEKVLATMRWVLEPYKVIDRPTGNKENFRAFYLIDAKKTGKEKNEGFIIHLQPRHTLNKINVYLGLPEKKLRIPDDLLRLRPTDQKNQCQFDIYLNKPYDWVLAFLLAVQVVEYQSKNCNLKNMADGF
jgi:hypothetical protein